MVGMSISFSQPQFQTPHGGPPFQGWRKGFGFGKAIGPGGYMQEPSIPTPLRYTPKGDRGLASNPFWRTKQEVGQATGLGIGDRPAYTMANPDAGPDTYGDVSKHLRYAKRNYVRAGVTVKARFMSQEQKYNIGPGPAKYNTSIPVGQSSLVYAVKCPSFGMKGRPMPGTEDLAGLRQPGPGEYNVQVPPGKNSPILHGTLYDITCGARVYAKEIDNGSPGPARYWVKGELTEKYRLAEKIANIEVPKTMLPKEAKHSVGARKRKSGRSSSEAADSSSATTPALAEKDFGPSYSTTAAGTAGPSTSGTAGVNTPAGGTAGVNTPAEPDAVDTLLAQAEGEQPGMQRSSSTPSGL